MQTFDLKRLRKDKNLTQVDIAELFSCKQNFISNIEAGLRSLPQDKLEILQYKFGDISEYIIDDGDDNAPSGDIPSGRIFSITETLRQVLKMMNDNLIVPYGWLEEKDKEIARLNKTIGKLEAQLEASKKMEAPQGGNVACADAK
jgi:transcriptional regulator with XRE-family HTH domain